MDPVQTWTGHPRFREIPSQISGESLIAVASASTRIASVMLSGNMTGCSEDILRVGDAVSSAGSFVMRARAPGPCKSESGPSFTIDCADVAVEPQRTGEPPTTGHLSVARRMKERARSPAIDMAKLQTVWGRSLHGLFLQTPFLSQRFGVLSMERNKIAARLAVHAARLHLWRTQAFPDPSAFSLLAGPGSVQLP